MSDTVNAGLRSRTLAMHFSENEPDPRSAAGQGEAKTVRQLRQVLLWPVQLLALSEEAEADNHWDPFAVEREDNPWRELDDEFGDPTEFQERHYNEFITFLPPVQRFLYGQPIGGAKGRRENGSGVKVMRRTDIRSVRVVLDEGVDPLMLDVVHVDLYFFFDIDIAILAIEVAATDLPFETALDVLFRFGRAYPAYWEEDGRGGHCPWKVEWLDGSGAVLAASDYERREKYLSFVCAHRAPCIASHWEFLLRPLVLDHSSAEGEVRYRQLEYYRMPFMAFLALDDPAALTRSDYVRLALGTASGDAQRLPYAPGSLADFEARYCFDRYAAAAPGHDGAASSHGVRFMATGHTLLVVGAAADPFFINPTGGYLGRFRHQHFLMFLLAHTQKASLRMFADKLVAMVSKLDAKDPDSGRDFRRSIRATLEHFLRFAQRAWFQEISNHAQMRELFAMTRRHLGLEPLYKEVREELQDMGNFLDVEAMRRQNETVVRLTVVTTFGLIGTVTTGFLGMNLLAWSEEPVEWRIVAFLVIFVPTLVLTLYTVVKSRRLSEFLDALSDERASTWDCVKAFWRVWFPPRAKK